MEKKLDFSFRRLLLCFILFSVISPKIAFSECKLTGKVVKITDGDSIVVLDRTKKQHKIRLMGIDAPERKQPFGKKSKQYLSSLIGKKWVCVDWHKLDKYKRKIGKIIFNKADVNYQMVKKGFAWHFKRYEKEQARNDAKKYAIAEVKARSSLIGVWSEPDPIAPWDWRKGKRPIILNNQQKQVAIQTKRQATPKGNYQCGEKRYCKHMDSCAEAKFYLTQCRLSRLDRDHDGIPCESICKR